MPKQPPPLTPLYSVLSSPPAPPLSFLSDTVAPQLCMEICDGYKFSGTQWGKQCFCGGEDTNHLLHGESEDCDMPCTGDENETCGGFDAMEVREFT